MDIYRLKAGYTLVGARALTYEYNNKVLLLVDGREELVELTGFALWNSLSIDLEEIERIEVIRGPGSALYGANAMAAVVSVTTVAKRPDFSTAFTALAGETGLWRLSGRLQNSHDVLNGLLSYRLSLGLDQERSPSDIRDLSLGIFRSHGYLRYQDRGGLDFSLHGGIATGEGMFYFFVGDARIPNMLVPWVMAKADYRIDPEMKLRFQAYYQSHSSDILMRTDLRALGVWLADIPDLYWRSDTADIQAGLEWQVVEDLLVIGGLNLRYSTAQGENFIIDDDDELRGAGVVHLELTPWEFFQLTLGLRLDVNELTGANASPRAVAIVRPQPNHSLRFGYGMAFRKPSFFETRLHLDIQDFNQSVPEIKAKLAEDFSNPDLDNVQTQSLEAGWRGSFLDSRLWLSLDLFYNSYQGRIFFLASIDMRMGLPDIHNSDLRFMNSSQDISLAGGEFEVAYRPFQEWTFLCNVHYRRTVAESVTLTSYEEPAVRVNAGASYSQTEGLTAEVFLHGVTDYDQVLLRPNDVLNPETLFVSLGSQLLLVGHLGYRAFCTFTPDRKPARVSGHSHPPPPGRRLRRGLRRRTHPAAAVSLSAGVFLSIIRR
jgi:iron complex outermembrane receptor protein